MANYHITLETFSANVRMYEADDDLVARCEETDDLGEVWDEYDDEMGGDYTHEFDVISPQDDGLLTVTDEEGEDILSTELSEVPFESSEDEGETIEEGRYLVKVYHQENVMLEGDMEIEGDFSPEKLYFSTAPALQGIDALNEGPLADPRNLMYKGQEDDCVGLDYLEDEGESEEVLLLELDGDGNWTCLKSSEE